MMLAVLLSISLVLEAGTPLRLSLDERLTVHQVGQQVTATVVEDTYAYHGGFRLRTLQPS